jgi:hypothetical protein
VGAPGRSSSDEPSRRASGDARGGAGAAAAIADALRQTYPIGKGVRQTHTLGGWLFPGDEDGHLSPRWVGKLMAGALPDHWTAHTLRHRFATRAYRGSRCRTTRPNFASSARSKHPVSAIRLRATQFHDLIKTTFSIQRFSPVLRTLRGVRFQPIHTRDVAARLVELVDGEPMGRAPDVGGPAVHTHAELARMYLAARGGRRRVVDAPAPGRIVAAFRMGANLAPDRPIGTVGFDEYLAQTT